MKRHTRANSGAQESLQRLQKKEDGQISITVNVIFVNINIEFEDRDYYEATDYEVLFRIFDYDGL